jgi:hypothetical protein
VALPAPTNDDLDRNTMLRDSRGVAVFGVRTRAAEACAVLGRFVRILGVIATDSSRLAATPARAICISAHPPFRLSVS